MSLRSGLLKDLSSTGLTGIRLIWQFIPRTRSASMAASSREVFSPSTQLYSKVMPVFSQLKFPSELVAVSVTSLFDAAGMATKISLVGLSELTS